ncbi:probable F-box protein At5g04010 [Pistacia vera]|uniref:probable F-box protein At5g04010 n=1 Tax=Pistacia vera TaxID=55513 RepID=UPI001263C388|nr:probable F-box protein At5g04010 [Pistacia vera]
MSPLSSTNPPPWEVLNLLAHHLDPKSLAIASCVSKSWLISFSSDQIWQPICTTHYPSLSNLKLTHLSIPYHRIYAVAYSATKRRQKPPSRPRLFLHDLIFAIDLRTKNNVPLLTIAKPVNELCSDANGVFKFDVNVDDCEGLEMVELSEEVKIAWNVVLKGWGGAFTMMDCEGKLSFIPGAEGWFSEELPSPRCCSSDVASGIVADMKLGICSRRGNGGKVRVEKVSVGMLSIVNWRYVNVDDGLRYLQHFLLPNDECWCHGV